MKNMLTFVRTSSKICLVLETESNLVNAKHELSTLTAHKAVLRWGRLCEVVREP